MRITLWAINLHVINVSTPRVEDQSQKKNYTSEEISKKIHNQFTATYVTR